MKRKITKHYELPEIVVRGKKPLRYVMKPEDQLDFIGSLTGGLLSFFSPTQVARKVYDVSKSIKNKEGIDKIGKALFQTNSGVVTKKFEKEHPIGAAITNLIGDVAIPAGLLGTAKGLNYLARMDMPRFGYAPTTKYLFAPGYTGMNGGRIQSSPISYGYDREKVAKAASLEFGLDMSVRRPILYRMANEDNTLADALDLVKSGKSETRFGTGSRTMIEPEPHSVLTGTYLDLKTGLPTVRGVGLLGTKPVPVTPLEGSYKSSGRFGNMVSVTDVLDGAGKYGFRNYSEIENYLNTLGLNDSLLKYAKDVISRLKSFDSQIQFGTETTQGLIPKNMRNTPEFLQYAKDHLELSDILSGNLNWGAKNLRVIFNAPKSRSIITGESDNPGFATRTASINMPLKDFSGNEFKQFMDRGIPKSTWPNGMVVEDYLAKYNSSPLFLRIILSSKNNPMVLFPLHFRGTGPNPIPGMTTMQVSGIKPTLKKGGKINVLKLKVLIK